MFQVSGLIQAIWGLIFVFIVCVYSMTFQLLESCSGLTMPSICEQT
jgi:hypothetical protein